MTPGDGSPYAPPVADVAGPVASAGARAEVPPFFAVSVTKLVLLSVCTFSLYEIYWVYKNWERIKARERSDVSPAWRAAFGVFFFHPILRRVREEDTRNGGAGIPVGLLTFGWIATNMGQRLPDPFWLVSLLSVLFLVPAQIAVNRIDARVAPGHDRNARFSGLNWVALVLGGAFWAVVLIGMLLPAAP